MKITFKNISKIELTIDSSGHGSIKMSCPAEETNGTNGSEIELFFKSCEYEFSNDEIVVKKLYLEDYFPAVVSNETKGDL